MRTIVRGLLFSILLAISLPLMLSVPAVNLIDRLAVNYSLTQRLTISGLVTLASIAGNEIAFALVPASGPPVVGRRILHSLVMAGMSVMGFVVLAAVDWGAPVAASGFLDLRASWPFIAVGGIWFAAYLVVSAIVCPAQSPLVSLPRGLRRYVLPGEEVLCRIQQTRLLSPVTPDNLVATDQRLIEHRPTNLGLTSTITDYNYQYIASIKTERGWMYCTVSIEDLFRGQEVAFTYMPKRGAARFVQVVTREIARYRAAPLPQPSGGVVPAAGPPQTVGRRPTGG